MNVFLLERKGIDGIQKNGKKKKGRIQMKEG
jgi:hypothetical protein